MGPPLNTCILHDDDLTPERRLTAPALALYPVYPVVTGADNLSLFPSSLRFGLAGDVCRDAAVGDGPTCLTLLGSLHAHHLCRGGGEQARTEAVLERDPLRGERTAIWLFFFSSVQECSCSNKRNLNDFCDMFCCI